MKKAIIIRIIKWAKGEVELAKLSTLLLFSSHFFENFKKVGEVGSRVGLAGSLLQSFASHIPSCLLY